MPVIRLPQLAWYGTKELELPLPDSWQVEFYNMAGFDRPAMKPDEIRVAITNLIDSPPIKELARGKNEVVIIFDDMTRVTKVAELVPFVLEELASSFGMRLQKRWPLGFGDCQAAVVFEDSCPNNSLPVLWDRSLSWTPLFERL